MLACGNQQADAVVRNLATRHEVALRGHDAEVRTLQFSPDGTIIATGSRDGSVKLWDASTFDELRTLRGHSSYVQGLAFSPDGSLMVSSGRDFSIRVWNLAGLLATSDCAHPDGPVQDIVFAKSLDGFLSLSTKGTIELWDKNTGRSRKPPTFERNDVLRMAISMDDVLSLCTKSGIMLHDLRRGNTTILDLGGRPPTYVDGAPNNTPVAFSRDGRFCALAGADGSVQVWDLVTNNKNAFFCCEHAHRGPASCVAFHPFQQQLVSGGQDGTIHLWDLATKQHVRSFEREGHRGDVACLAYTPDGRVLASSSFDNTIKLWKVEEADETPITIAAHIGSVKTVLISLSGRTLVSTGGDKTVRLFDVATTRTKATLRGHKSAVYRLAWSDDESVLASADSGDGASIRFWRAK